jgi:beta-N-acetylhexosaminidase
MTLQTDPGKHFIVGFNSTTLSDEERRKWSELKPLGTIIFTRNIERNNPKWPEELRSTLAELKSLSEREDFIVSIDHEGGRVHRLAHPVTHFPAPVSWGAHTEEVGRAIGEELALLGVTLNFAPSFDILTENANKVIGDRSFGEDPYHVAEQALSFLAGLESMGVCGIAKHFPGHGATKEDSHEVLPSVDTPLDVLHSRELIPFIRYIKSGRQLVMTAHVVIRSIDPTLPATISKPVLSGLLREQLGYQGALITDALDMGALSGFTPHDVARAFVQATGDLFCVCQAKERLPIDSALEFAEALSTENLAPSSERIERFIRFHHQVVSRQGKASGFGRYARLNDKLRSGIA